MDEGWEEVFPGPPNPEQADETLYRLSVPGGWLYATVSSEVSRDFSGDYRSRYTTTAMAFVPAVMATDDE